jgi:hypothetical protein
MESVWANLGNRPWYALGVAVGLWAGLLLLFVDKLPSKLSEYLLPGVVVYGLGVFVLGYIESSIYRKLSNRDGSEKTKFPVRRMIALHALWFGCFLAYLLYRVVL